MWHFRRGHGSLGNAASLAPPPAPFTVLRVSVFPRQSDRPLRFWFRRREPSRWALLRWRSRTKNRSTTVSWRSLGVDARGRSYTLHINYRTSHQIRIQADRLLPPALADVDGNPEDRRGTVSVFNGPAPEIRASMTRNWSPRRLVHGLQGASNRAFSPMRSRCSSDRHASFDKRGTPSNNSWPSARTQRQDRGHTG